MSKELSKKEEEGLVNEAQNEAMAMFIEEMLPKVTPFIKPAANKFNKFMTEGDYTIIIKPIDGTVHIFQIKDSDIGEFALKEGKEPIASFEVQEFIEKLIKGDFGKSS